MVNAELRCLELAEFCENLLEFGRIRAFKNPVKYCGFTISMMYNEHYVMQYQCVILNSALNLSVKRICYN
jgi:hypothetical protein